MKRALEPNKIKATAKEWKCDARFTNEKCSVFNKILLEVKTATRKEYNTKI